MHVLISVHDNILRCQLLQLFWRESSALFNRRFLRLNKMKSSQRNYYWRKITAVGSYMNITYYNYRMPFFFQGLWKYARIFFSLNVNYRKFNYSKNFICTWSYLKGSSKRLNSKYRHPDLYCMLNRVKLILLSGDTALIKYFTPAKFNTTVR